MHHKGDVAQTVERSLCMRKTGSIPRISIFFFHLYPPNTTCRFFFIRNLYIVSLKPNPTKRTKAEFQYPFHKAFPLLWFAFTFLLTFCFVFSIFICFNLNWVLKVFVFDGHQVFTLMLLKKMYLTLFKLTHFICL